MKHFGIKCWKNIRRDNPDYTLEKFCELVGLDPARVLKVDIRLDDWGLRMECVVTKEHGLELMADDWKMRQDEDKGLTLHPGDSDQ